MAAEAIAEDAAALRQGAELPEAAVDQKAAEEEDDSSEDEPEELPPPPMPVAKLYAIPRDYKRLVEVRAEAEGRQVKCVPVGPDYGEGSGSKFVYAVKAAKENSYFCVPYDGRKVLKVGADTGDFQEIGKTFKKEGGKYTEAIASTNSHGRMYAAPCRAQRILEIDSTNGQIKEVGPILGSKTINKWWAIAASAGGRIYAIPYDAPRVLEIDPNRGGAAKMVGPDLGPGKGKYCCVAEAPNGNLYCAPLNANRVLEIDTLGNVRLAGPDLGDQERKYACLVQAPNKLLYSPPLYADRVLEINCARGDTREIGEILGVGEAKYSCAAVASYNGKVYCAPLEARKVLEIDPDHHEAHQIGLDLGGADIEKYSCICAAPAPSTNLYAAPRNAHCFIEICPRRAFVREVGNDHGRCPRKFTCIVPGVIWQGGVLQHDYQKLREKQEAEHKARVERYHKRVADRRMKLIMEGKYHERGPSKAMTRQQSDGLED
jgi:hypothetical protein